ncbi:hypothetical protein RBG61_11795 [Paludicola sp. MB14-C6]|nr:hypothetical protein [Paludicola sp. MB14-C6]WMJ22665.1 hypothetical protein RBG61_11795 [Paludicola sp. MB14-C6]
MELTLDLKNIGYSLIDTSEAKLDGFIGVEIKSHSKYIVEHSNSLC